jgi:hypothetical protein
MEVKVSSSLYAAAVDGRTPAQIEAIKSLLMAQMMKAANPCASTRAAYTKALAHCNRLTRQGSNMTTNEQNATLLRQEQEISAEIRAIESSRLISTEQEEELEDEIMDIATSSNPLAQRIAGSLLLQLRQLVRSFEGR